MLPKVRLRPFLLPHINKSTPAKAITTQTSKEAATTLFQTNLTNR